MIENVMPKRSSHAKRINLGVVHNVFQRNGSAMEIRIVSTVPMRTQPYTTVLLHNHVLKISSNVRMADA